MNLQKWDMIPIYKNKNMFLCTNCPEKKGLFEDLKLMAKHEIRVHLWKLTMIDKSDNTEYFECKKCGVYNKGLFTRPFRMREHENEHLEKLEKESKEIKNCVSCIPNHSMEGITK